MMWGAVEQAAAETLISLALAEDLGDRGDVTTQALVQADERGTVDVVARQAGVLAGGAIIPRVFAALQTAVICDICVADGGPVARGTVVARLTGPLRDLLTGERTVLNFLTHLSGVATLTRRYVDAVAGTRAGIYDTRKTLPGWRHLEKYAVRAGGGQNHRLGLHDMMLI